MTARTLMLFSHICNPNHMTGAEKLLHFMLRELVPYHRTLLVVPNEGMLAARARSLGVEVIVHPYPLLWEMWNPGPSFVEQLQHFRQPQQLSALMNLIHMHRPDIVDRRRARRLRRPLTAALITAGRATAGRVIAAR